MDRTNSIARGLGTLMEVTEYSLDGFEPIDHIHDDIREAFKALEILLAHPTSKLVALRLAAAVLNTQVGKSGRFVSMDSVGNLSFSIYYAGADRDAMKDLIYGG